MKILECSTKGDKRFSALYAKIHILGRTDSIENHYQRCKKFTYYKGDPKGKKPDHFLIGNMKIDSKYLTQYYYLLWIIYFDNNPKLVKFAKEFDDFHDTFKSKKSLNSQEDAIRKYIKDSRKSILNECKELIKILKNGGIIK